MHLGGFAETMSLRSWLHALTAPSPVGTHLADTTAEIKLVCIVNHGLKMSKGKLAAQVGHASVIAALKSIETNPAVFEAWRRQGQRKVVVKAVDSEQIDALLTKAKEAGIQVGRVHDAGRTQIPAGSLTVGIIGPAEEVEIDPLTQHLKLL